MKLIEFCRILVFVYAKLKEHQEQRRNVKMYCCHVTCCVGNGQRQSIAI